MIQMDVREQNISDIFLRAQAQGGGGGASVDEERIIDKETGQFSSRYLPSGATEDAEFHSTEALWSGTRVGMPGRIS
jgi:hypothetical protein